MLTIVRTRWHDETDDGIMLIDFDEAKVRCEAEATKAIESVLYALAKGADGDPFSGDLVELIDDDALAEYGARLVDDSFMVVSVEGYARPLATYDPPEGMRADAPAPKVGVDENGLSLAIALHALPEADMLSAGFRSVPRENPDHYYRFQQIMGDISLNVTVPKDGGRGRIDVLDEAFCQPYDYQHILAHHPDHPFATQVRERVENEMEKLVDAGIVSGWSRGDYI